MGWFKTDSGLFVPGHGLGARPNPDYVRALPRISTGLPLTSLALPVNTRLDLPYQYIPKYDQGEEGACVGFAWSWAMSILNRRLYAARQLYLECQFIDPFADTPPEQGTSIGAGAEILQTRGHWRFARGIMWPLALLEGIESFYHAQTVDEIRTAIHYKKPAVLAIPWFSNFDSPEWKDYGREPGPRWWIGKRMDLIGHIRGWHAICLFGARDAFDAFSLVNSWGYNYPIVNLPYTTMDFLFSQGAEVIIPVDRSA